jgi:hypothetical protein
LKHDACWQCKCQENENKSQIANKYLRTDSASMAAGSRKKYALDLNDIIAFPDAGHMPVFPPEEKESWILLMEVCNPQVIPTADYILG